MTSDYWVVTCDYLFADLVMTSEYLVVTNDDFVLPWKYLVVTRYKLAMTSQCFVVTRASLVVLLLLVDPR